MMTNVDLEGFRDWNDKELEEAVKFIRDELNNRQRRKTYEALLKVKEALNTLKKECGDIELSLNGHYNFDALYAKIEAEVK